MFVELTALKSADVRLKVTKDMSPVTSWLGGEKTRPGIRGCDSLPTGWSFYVASNEAVRAFEVFTFFAIDIARSIGHFDMRL